MSTKFGFAFAAALVLATAPAAAQDSMPQGGQVFSDDLIRMQGEHMTSVGTTNLNNSIVRRKMQGRAGEGSASSNQRARAKCASARSQHSASDPGMQGLFALCDKAGY